MQNGGDGEIRTLAALANPNALAKRPLQPTWVHLHKMAERVGFEPTEGYKPSAIFKTAALNQLDHLSVSVDYND